MNALTSTDVLRPRGKGLKPWLTALALSASPLAFDLFRRFWPIPQFGKTCVATWHDDVLDVFEDDAAFAAPYKPKLDVITGGQPFFLGLQQSQGHEVGRDAVQRAVLREDLPRLAAQVEAQAEAAVEGAAGRIDVVDALVRRVTFGVLGPYLGVPKPPVGELQVWATRLFEFQFADQGDDPSLRADVDQIAPALRAHVQATMDARRAAGLGAAPDDVMGRLLALQAAGDAWYTDAAIRTAVTCLLVGGPPQPPMVVPQGMEQLLRRPEALAGAQKAARDDDDDLLRRYLMEAMRFDPLAPGLPRLAVTAVTIAGGHKRARTVPEGSNVLAAFASAMMDERRVPDPGAFRTDRSDAQYIHFGHGVHKCFGLHINHATLHLMLKPLLKRPNLRRAPGPSGHLSKNGVFADRLVVEFD